MARCKFCKDLEWFKDKSKDLRKAEGINTYFKSALYYWRTKERVAVGAGNAGLYPLNYCPQCGTKLIKQTKQKKNIKKENNNDQ